MRRSSLICLALLVVLAGVPLLLGGREGSRAGERRLIVVTPHVQQIRVEFGRAFREWHAAHYPEDPPVSVDFRSPGGTSEILRLLQAQYNGAIADGRIAPDGSCPPGTIGFDLMFGGGAYEHGRLAAGEGVRIIGADGSQAALPMSVPAGFDAEQIAAWFPVDRVGTQPLWHPEQRWIGTALSSFGIVYNRPLVLGLLGKERIETFDDLGDPRLAGWVAMADPRQSGSLSTTLDAILSSYGWEEGWRLLRRIAANSRTFVASSARPPLDVSQGEAAAALAIDFYGRAQAQAILRPGQNPDEGRVGYIDPAGSVYIDPDPISILRGGPDPELARRFVEFVMSREGQALWQFRSQRTLAADPALPRPPATADGRALGPREYELRRLPVLPSMYDPERGDLEFMIDRVDPFAIATDAEPRGWRAAIAPMMGAFAIDSARQCREAWAALNLVASDPSSPAEVVGEMESHFYAMPRGEQVRAAYERYFGLPGAGEREDPDAAPWDAFQDFTPENFRSIRATWRTTRWAARLKVCYTQVFRENYAEVVRIADEHRAGRSARAP